MLGSKLWFSKALIKKRWVLFSFDAKFRPLLHKIPSDNDFSPAETFSLTA